MEPNPVTMPTDTVLPDDWPVVHQTSDLEYISQQQVQSDPNDNPLHIEEEQGELHQQEETTSLPVEHRRSERERKQPSWMKDFVVNHQGKNKKETTAEISSEYMALTKSLSFSLRRKRVLISHNNNNNNIDFNCFTPMKKKLCFPEIHHQSSSSLLEDLPQELLIKVVCGVDHEDLKQLFFVSKTVRDSAIIAKKLHFAYSTPSKTKAFRNSIEMLNNLESFDEIIVPNAPKQAHRRMKRSRFERKLLGNVAVALFVADDEVQRWPRRSLFMDIDS
ncbi:hypothetical protein KSS87_013695 [Heliosperma pusillum]|nr:hypothetical protein KSS87_013695 [Heliosperma pusillum]